MLPSRSEILVKAISMILTIVSNPSWGLSQRQVPSIATHTPNSSFPVSLVSNGFLHRHHQESPLPATKVHHNNTTSPPPHFILLLLTRQTSSPCVPWKSSEHPENPEIIPKLPFLFPMHISIQPVKMIPITQQRQQNTSDHTQDPYSRNSSGKYTPQKALRSN